MNFDAQHLCRKGGRGGLKTRFCYVPSSESYPGVVVVTDDLRPEILLQASAFGRGRGGGDLL
jgi:hypothetical protein